MEIVAFISALIGIPTGIWYFYDKFVDHRKTKEPTEWPIKEKSVNSDWVEKSGVKEQWSKKGCRVIWANNENVESLLLSNHVLALFQDNANGINYKIVREGQTLMALEIMPSVRVI